MRAYVYFTQDKFNINSALDGDDIVETLFGEQMRESEDHAFIEIETLPNRGDRIFFSGDVTLECEVVQIYHQVSLMSNTHTVKIILTPLPLNSWLKY